MSMSPPRRRYDGLDGQITVTNLVKERRHVLDEQRAHVRQAQELLTDESLVVLHIVRIELEVDALEALPGLDKLIAEVRL